MGNVFDYNDALVGEFSLKAIKAFLEASRLKSFTLAANAMCVTPAAISKQIKGLEEYLGVELFIRSGRELMLTSDGEMFRDAVQLSMINIHQAAERLRKRLPERKAITVCCSPAFSSLWLHKRLPIFMSRYPEIEITVLATQNFMSMESGVVPDIYIGKLTTLKDGYRSELLFEDVVYPVCTPRYLENNKAITSVEHLMAHFLLDISAYSRSQISEHIGWQVWLSLQGVDFSVARNKETRMYSTNDYPSIIDLTLSHQGISLGWHHLISPLIDNGKLIMPLPNKVTMNNRGHYISVRNDRQDSMECDLFYKWVKEECALQNNECLSTKS